jgi:hypothetical protein
VTVAEERRRVLAERLRRAGLARDDAEPARPRVDRSHAPLSFAQLHAWRHQQRVPGSVANNLGIRLTLRGEVDEDALVAAFETIGARHEVLRTTFHADADGPWSTVHDELPVPVERLDLRGAPPGEHARLTAARTAVPFDLATAPAWRITIARTGDHETTVVLVVQHLLWDGPTFGVLCSDLSAAYIALTAGREPDRTGPARQVADVAAEERSRWRDRPTADEDRRYWTARLSPLPRPAPGEVGERGARVDRRLAAVSPGQMRAAALAVGVTPFALAIACWAEVWGRFTGTDDVTLGTLAVRRGPDEAGLVGNFANPVTLRLDATDEPGPVERVRRAHAECAAALAHGDYPFLPLAEELAGHDGTGPVPFFDSLVVFLTGDLGGPELPGVTAEWERVDHGGVQFPLVPLGVELFVRTEGIDVQLTHDVDRLDAVVVAGLLDDLDATLRRTVDAAIALTRNEVPR